MAEMFGGPMDGYVQAVPDFQQPPPLFHFPYLDRRARGAARDPGDPSYEPLVRYRSIYLPDECRAGRYRYAGDERC